MTREISEETVLQVAKLAKIEITEECIPVYQDQLSKIVDYVGQISLCPSLDQIEPFFGACDSQNATRDDLETGSYPREAMLKNAPLSDGEFYLVPPVFD